MNLIDIKISRHRNIVSGIEIKQNSYFYYLLYNPVDFVFDGYVLVNKNFIKEISHESNENIRYKIIHKKKDKVDRENELNLSEEDNLVNVLAHFHEKKTLIQVELETDDYCLIGNIIKINEKSFILKELSASGKFIREENIRFDKIRSIYFESDYLKSYEEFIKDHNEI